jgi:hypothetical protein
MAWAAPLPPSAVSRTTLAKFVLEVGGKGYVRRSTAAAPATHTLMVDLTATIADVPAGGVFCSETTHCVALLGASPAFAVCPCVCPLRATKAHTLLPHAYESRDACAWSDRSYAFATRRSA